jgi:hypothetical protein
MCSLSSTIVDEFLTIASSLEVFVVTELHEQLNSGIGSENLRRNRVGVLNRRFSLKIKTEGFFLIFLKTEFSVLLFFCPSKISKHD